MPGHYQGPPPPKQRLRPPAPPKPKNPFDEQNTEDAAGGTYKTKPVPGGLGPKGVYTPEKD